MMSDEEKKDVGIEKEPVLSRPELVKRVQTSTGAKLKDVQAIVRATLEAMGVALRSGERLHLPPFGSARALKKVDGKEGVMRIILRDLKEKEPPAVVERPATARKPGKGKKQALAATGEAE